VKNILIPTDFSDNSWNAIVYALKFFEKSTCNFYLLHVNVVNDMVIGGSPLVPTQKILKEVYIEPSKRQLQKLIDRLKQITVNKKHRFFTLTDYNLFIDSIRNHVEDKKIDFIVMGTKGASGLKQLIIGSNAGAVVRRVHCNTLIVPENATYSKPEEIVFPTDFSSFYSSNILQPIIEILEANNACVRIIHISKKEPDLNENQSINKEYLEDYFDNYNHSFHFLKNNHIEDAIQGFVESENTNLIIMVAKNLNYFQRILFHPTVEKISYHTDVPFLVLHE